MPQRLDLPSTPPPRRTVDSALLRDPGSLRFATDSLPWQRSLRWRGPPRNWFLIALGIVFAVLMAALQLLGFVLGMRPYRIHHPDTSVIHVTLLEPTVEPLPPPPPPEPEPPPFVARPSRIPIAPPRVRVTPPPPRPAEPSDAMSGRIGAAGTAEPAPAPQLFNPDGSVRLNGTLKMPEMPKTERERAAARWTQIEQAGKNPLNCQRTRFAGKYAPDETVGSGIARKYLSWVGLYDPHDTERRAQRAAEGCDPAQ
jgi:hypothetical protein